MDIKHEIVIKDELLVVEKDYDETNDQIYATSGLQKISDDDCVPDIDFKSEIKIEEESGLNDFQNVIEEDHEEKGDVLQRSSLGSEHQDLRRGNKGPETHEWKKFCCSNCNFKFEREEKLVSHLKSLCKSNVKCSRCGCDCNCESNSKMYSSKHSNIDKNILNTNSFNCSDCSLSYKRKSNLKRHILSHQKTKLFKCSECDYECNEKVVLKRHMLKHRNPKLFKCSECDYRCNEKGNLRKHILRHQNIILFKCSECDYGCRTKNDLGRHMLTHQNVKLFKCNECDYECNYKGNLKKHTLIHRNIKLFKCSECDYESSAKGNLKRHTLTHQNKSNNVQNVTWNVMRK